MKFVDRTFPTITFGDFCDAHGIEVSVYERPNDIKLPRYYATDHNVDIMEPGILVGALGNGNTKENAILAYAKELTGKLITVSCNTKNRRDVQCPNEWAKETL